MSYNKSFEDSIYRIKEENNIDFLKLDWKSISSFRNLSEKFMTDFSEYLDWSVACTHQKMSEKLMRTFYEKVNYKSIGITQINQMSIEFILENKALLNMSIIKKNKKYWNNPKKCSYIYELFENEFQKYFNKTKICDDMLIDLVFNELTLSTKGYKHVIFKSQEC